VLKAVSDLCEEALTSRQEHFMVIVVQPCHCCEPVITNSTGFQPLPVAYANTVRKVRTNPCPPCQN
jgi:hypothetical protein